MISFYFGVEMYVTLGGLEPLQIAKNSGILQNWYSCFQSLMIVFESSERRC